MLELWAIRRSAVGNTEDVEGSYIKHGQSVMPLGSSVILTPLGRSGVRDLFASSELT